VVSGVDYVDFPDLGAPALAAYAHDKAARLGLSIPPAYLEGVLENLAILQTQAAILRSALEAAGAPPAGPETS
jgi:hypothetical protein